MKERINKCRKRITLSFTSFFNRAVRKETSRNLIILLFAIVIGVFIETLRRDLNLATALVAFGTLILAFFTFLSIMNSRDRETRDRKELLLDEIIKWAIDVDKPKYDLNLISVISSRSSIEDQSSALLISWASHIDTLIVRGDYLAKITLIFTKNLRIAVEKVRNELKKQASYFSDLIHDKDSPEAISEHNYALTQSAKKVIEEAAKIKTRDIR